MLLDFVSEGLYEYWHKNPTKSPFTFSYWRKRGAKFTRLFFHLFEISKYVPHKMEISAMLKNRNQNVNREYEYKLF